MESFSYTVHMDSILITTENGILACIQKPGTIVAYLLSYEEITQD